MGQLTQELLLSHWTNNQLIVAQGVTLATPNSLLLASTGDSPTGLGCKGKGVLAYIVLACIVIAYIVMTYIIMA